MINDRIDPRFRDLMTKEYLVFNEYKKSLRLLNKTLKIAKEYLIENYKEQLRFREIKTEVKKTKINIKLMGMHITDEPDERSHYITREEATDLKTRLGAREISNPSYPYSHIRLGFW